MFWKPLWVAVSEIQACILMRVYSYEILLHNIAAIDHFYNTNTNFLNNTKAKVKFLVTISLVYYTSMNKELITTEAFSY